MEGTFYHKPIDKIAEIEGNGQIIFGFDSERRILLIIWLNPIRRIDIDTLHLAAPDQLRVQVAVPAFVGIANGALLILAHHRLVLGRRDIFAGRLDMGEGFNGFGVLFLFS